MTKENKTMNIIEKVEQSFHAFLKSTFDITDHVIATCTFDLNIDTSKQAFGDINSNCAMILAKKLKQNPKEIANTIKETFNNEYLEKIEVAGPGFLNFFLTKEVFKTLAQQLFIKKNSFFKPTHLQKQNFNIEFVSANPTGPLHVGHGRGGIIGDVLGNILRFIGHNVTKEYYVNDAGAQMQKLGISFKIRCQQELGIDTKLPDDAYHGQYLVDLAKKAIAQEGNAILEKSDTFFQDYAKDNMLDQIKQTLLAYGIQFDVWFSEKSLHTDGQVKASLDILGKKGLLFEKDGAIWFKSTEFGDDKDRVVIKSDGQMTYVASDIGYMENKIKRGFNHLVMVLGHDHHSYAVRLEGLRQALAISAPLSIILYQLIKMKASGQMVRMSKRTGKMITLADVIQMVGKDVARFFYLNRKADAQLDFDLDLAMKKTEENPVFYVQYAYVRTKSILKKAASEAILSNITDCDAAHIGKPEHFLIKKIVSLKLMLTNISHNFHTHLLTYYLIELANAFHSYYSKNRVIDLENPAQSRGRLLMIQNLQQTFETCLDLLGISKPEKM